MTKLKFISMSLSVAVIILCHCAPARAQTSKAPSLAALAASSGADREQRLVAGAKPEGKVVWYTSLAGTSYKDLAKGFESKYGIKIEPYRATSTDIMTKVTTEAQAKQVIADVVETTLPTLRFLRESNLLIPYFSRNLAKYPAQAKEVASKGLVYWAIDRETYMGVGYNTNLISANAIPKTYADLMKPELKGRSALCRMKPARARWVRLSKLKVKSLSKNYAARRSVYIQFQGARWPTWCCRAKCRSRRRSSAIMRWK